MSSSPKKKGTVLKKIISKKDKATPNLVATEQRMTRFKTKAKTCSICLSSIEKQGLLDCCQHEFCFSCIEKWSKTENTCPMCKQRFAKIKKVWNRIFYGGKAKSQPKENPEKTSLPPEEEKEIEVPTRNQSQTSEQLNSDLIEHLIHIVLGTFTRSRGGDENISIQILFADNTLVSTRFLPFD